MRKDCRWLLERLAIFVVALGFQEVAAAEQHSLLAVGLEKQLFVDDWIVGEKTGVFRELGVAEKANGGRPIFTDGWFYGTVLYDRGRFRLWWRKPGRDGFGLAESDDGIHFHKVADVTGIPFAGDFTLAVMVDAHETDPEHRYKAAYDAVGMAAGLARSADGIHWTPYNDGRPVTGRAADTYNQLQWDEAAKTYRLFTRTDFGTAGGAAEWRGTRSMTNPDVKADPTAWTLVREWAFQRDGPAEKERRQIYALTDWLYHGVHFALMSVYEWPGDLSEGPTDQHRRHERDVMNFYLGTSRDADSWDLSWVYEGKPLVPRGGDGAFDKDIILPSSTVVTHDDRHWIYYAGANERHGTDSVRVRREHAIGLATLRLDGFVSLAARAEPGVVTTKPFRLEGRTLQVNVDASAGSFRTEVLDADGKPRAGFSGTEAIEYEKVDGLRFEPRWREHLDLGPLLRQTVRLRFHLRNARLYAFEVSGRSR